jgi:hypothetical protein
LLKRAAKNKRAARCVLLPPHIPGARCRRVVQELLLPRAAMLPAGAGGVAAAAVPPPQLPLRAASQRHVPQQRAGPAGRPVSALSVTRPSAVSLAVAAGATRALRVRAVQRGWRGPARVRLHSPTWLKPYSLFPSSANRHARARYASAARGRCQGARCQGGRGVPAAARTRPREPKHADTHACTPPRALQQLASALEAFDFPTDDDWRRLEQVRCCCTVSHHAELLALSARTHW